MITEDIVARVDIDKVYYIVSYYEDQVIYNRNRVP